MPAGQEGEVLTTTTEGPQFLLLDHSGDDGVDAAAVYVQDGNRDKPGPMLGAAYTLLH